METRLQQKAIIARERNFSYLVSEWIKNTGGMEKVLGGFFPDGKCNLIIIFFGYFLIKLDFGRNLVVPFFRRNGMVGASIEFIGYGRSNGRKDRSNSIRRWFHYRLRCTL